MAGCIRQHVSSGLYSSACEVIREALRLFEAQQTAQTASLAALQKDIQQGLADIEAGRVQEANFTALKQRASQKLAEQKAS